MELNPFSKRFFGTCLEHSLLRLGPSFTVAAVVLRFLLIGGLLLLLVAITSGAIVRSSNQPSNRRRKATPAGTIVVPHNSGDAEQTQDQSAVDVAEVSTTHMNYRSVFISDLSIQEVIGNSAPSFGEEFARMSPAELHSCCTQLDDFFRNRFWIYLEKFRVVGEYQIQLSERSNSIMEAQNEVMARWDEFQGILHLHHDAVAQMLSTTFHPGNVRHQIRAANAAFHAAVAEDAVRRNGNQLQEIHYACMVCNYNAFNPDL